MRFVQGQTVGIDLGTSSSALAQLGRDGQPVVLPNAEGQLITPSVILLGDEGRVVVGAASEALVNADPDRVVVGVKRQMGQAGYVKHHAGRELNAELLSAMILTKLKQDAERRIGPIGNAVITVPYYFTDPCRRATQEAGVLAGLNVVDLLNEPTAATLAYAWMKGELGRADLPETERAILVYDLGGGTFDVTVVQYTPTEFRVIATDGDTFLGGLDWTRRLTQHVGELFRREFGWDPQEDPHARLALMQKCEDLKRALSRCLEAPLRFGHRGRELKILPARRQFESLTADLLQRTIDTTEFVLDRADIEPRDIDEIVLVGGATYMPAVARRLEQLCGRRPSRDLDPQLAVAQGAAIHAAILEARETGGSGQVGQAVLQRLNAVTAHDVNSHSLGIEITDPDIPLLRRNHVMIPRNTPLPAEAVQVFCTNTANPRSIIIRLLEGEASDADSCTVVGDFRIGNLPPNLPVGAPVEVTYSYDENRRIHVNARELTSGNEASVELRWVSEAETQHPTAMRLMRAYTVR